MEGIIIYFLLYASGAVFLTVMLAVGVAWGIRWGLTWALKEVSRDPEFERWLKRIINSTDTQIDRDISKFPIDDSNQVN